MMMTTTQQCTYGGQLCLVHRAIFIGIILIERLFEAFPGRWRHADRICDLTGGSLLLGDLLLQQLRRSPMLSCVGRWLFTYIVECLKLSGVISGHTCELGEQGSVLR